METMHVFDQTNMYISVKNEITGLNEMLSDDTPIRYSENGTKLGYCFEDYDITSGDILNSGSYMVRQKSCKAHTGNAGNWYTWVTATASDIRNTGSKSNSICPRGWYLTPYNVAERPGFSGLLREIYSIIGENGGMTLLQPFSLLYSSSYSDVLNGRGLSGNYWSSSNHGNDDAYNLLIANNRLRPGSRDTKSSGKSLRCGGDISLSR